MTQPNQWTPPPPPQMRLAPLAPNGRPLASFGDRFLAALIDYAIYMGVSMAISIPLMFGWFFLMTSTMDDMGYNPDGGEVFAKVFLPMILIWLAMFLLIFGYSYAYYVEFQLRRNGQTFGKKVMKLQTVPVDPTATLTRGDLVKRWGVQWAVGSIVPLFFYLDSLWLLWDKPLQQCLHDKAASTVVVKVG